jgi:hypothetical protein
LHQQLTWDNQRIANTLQYLLEQQLAWLDTQGEGGPQYWVLGLVPGSSAE